MPPKNAPQEHDRNAEITTIASPYATNPASLLWAQQLKRENGHLLARMDSLETEHRTYNARIKSAETAADIARATDQKVKELSSRVDAIRDDENKQKDLYGRIIGDNHAKMEKASETWRKTQQKVSTLDTQYRSMQADMQQTSSSHDSTSRSIEAIQMALRRLEGTANSSDDGALVRRLDTIESYRNKEAEEARRMRDKVTSLERTCQTVTARNSELQAELNHLKATIETKAHVLSNTESFSRTNARTQTPASPGSNERADLNSFAESPAYKALQRRLTERSSVLTHSAQHNVQVQPISSRPIQTTKQIPGSDNPSLASAEQRRKGGVGAVKKLEASGGARGSRNPIRYPKTSKLQGAISSRVTRSQASGAHSTDLLGTPSSRTTRSQAQDTRVTKSLGIPSNPLIQSQGQNAQITTSIGPPSLATTHCRVKDLQVADYLDPSTTRITHRRAKKAQAADSPATSSVYNTRRHGKQLVRKKSMSTQPSKISNIRPPQEDSRNTASAKPSRVSALKLPPRNSQSSPGSSLVNVPLGKVCDDCRRRKVKCRHRDRLPVSARPGKRPADESTRSNPGSEPPKKKPRGEVQQLEDLDAFLNAGN